MYGLLTTTHNLGGPFARAIGNQIFGLFQPSLSDAANYLADTPRFRDTVAVSFVLSYAFAFASLGVLVLLPDQKAEAQRRKRTWPLQAHSRCVRCFIPASLRRRLLFWSGAAHTTHR